jgi:hypothetical protein
VVVKIRNPINGIERYPNFDIVKSNEGAQYPKARRR